MPSKLCGVNVTIIIYVFVLYCIVNLSHQYKRRIPLFSSEFLNYINIFIVTSVIILVILIIFYIDSFQSRPPPGRSFKQSSFMFLSSKKVFIWFLVLSYLIGFFKTWIVLCMQQMLFGFLQSPTMKLKHKRSELIWKRTF